MGKILKAVLASRFSTPILLILIVVSIYYKLFIFGKIPFPGDLLIASYSPWFDYYKIPVQNPLISDVFSLLFIWKYLAIDQIKNLQWPLWNPSSFTGTPLLANYQSSVLYPLNFLLLFPKYFGWGLFIFSQTLFAALGMYLLLSLWLPSKLARLTGSLIFALGGLMTTWVEFGTSVHGIAYLPISLFLIESYANTHKVRYPLLLILTLTLTILSGNPQVTIYSFVIVPLFAIIRLWNGGTLRSLINTFPILLAVILSVALSALQLLPSFELVQKSIRATENYIGQSNFGLLPTKDFLKFFVADFFGNPVTRNYWGFLNYFETSGFVGSLTLTVIIFAAIFLRKTRIIYFFFLLLVVSVVLCFNNPLSYFIYSFKIPFLTQSYASRMLFVTTFAISILSAFALNQIKLKPEKQDNFLKCVIWSWAIFVGILLGALQVHKIIKEILLLPHTEFYANIYLKDPEYQLSNFVVAIRNSLIPVIEISIFLLLYIIVIKINFLPMNKFFPSEIKKYRLSIICAALFVILTLDLSRYFLKFNPFIPEKFIFPQTPALEFLQKQPGYFRVGREHAEVLPPNTWTAYKLQSIEGYDVLHFREFGKFINHINGSNLLSSGTSRYAELTNYKSPFIDAANVKYFIALGRDRGGYIPGSFIDYKLEEANYKRVFKDGSAIILENPNALPRVYFATSFAVASQSQIENIINKDSTFDPRTEVAISSDLNIKTVTGIGSAEITSYTPNQVKIKTETGQDEILVLADQYEEGWKTKIDGKETQVSPANLIFRAVKIPSGNHEVIFYYWPKSFETGLKISAATAILIFLMILFSLKIRVL